MKAVQVEEYVLDHIDVRQLSLLTVDQTTQLLVALRLGDIAKSLDDLDSSITAIASKLESS